MIITTNINADIASANLFSPIIIAEDDENSHRLVAQLMVNGEDLAMRLVPQSTDHKIRMDYVRADGTVGSQNGSFDNGKISISLPDAVLQLDDIVKCEILYSYRVPITSHSVSASNGEIVVTDTETTTECPLRTGTFYIDSQLRVITEYEGGKI